MDNKLDTLVWWQVRELHGENIGNKEETPDQKQQKTRKVNPPPKKQSTKPSHSADLLADTIRLVVPPNAKNREECTLLKFSRGKARWDKQLDTQPSSTHRCSRSCSRRLSRSFFFCSKRFRELSSTRCLRKTWKHQHTSSKPWRPGCLPDLNELPALSLRPNKCTSMQSKTFGLCLNSLPSFIKIGRSVSTSPFLLSLFFHTCLVNIFPLSTH